MDALYVIQPGHYLRKQGDCIKIMSGKTVIDTIPAKGLKQLTLAGRVSLSGPVLDFLMDNHIDTVFMTPTGRYRARLLMDQSGHVELRQRQYSRLAEPSCKLAAATAIVRGKLENQVRLLLKRRSGQDIRPDVRQTAIQIRALQARLDDAPDVDAVRGIEGFASRLYFSVFGLLIKGDFSFHGRNRRPPRDPVNALLSFVYTLFTNTVLSAIQRSGLDPYLGALHETAHGRPSLACDLVEEWRVFAERLVLRLLNKRMVRPQDFVITPGDTPELQTVLMKPTACKALVTSFHRLLDQRFVYPPTGEQTLVRWIIYSQCRQFGESLKPGAAPYQPFLVSR